MSVKIALACFESVFTSNDEGQTWDLPGRSMPSYPLPTQSKDATYKDIPFEDPHAVWDFLHVDLQSGFGLAAHKTNDMYIHQVY